MPEFNSFEDIFDEIVKDTNSYVQSRLNSSLSATLDGTRWDTGRMVGNWNYTYNLSSLEDIDPVEFGDRKSEERYFQNRAEAYFRATQVSENYNIMENKTIYLGNATPYVQYWEPVDAMLRRGEEELTR